MNEENAINQVYNVGVGRQTNLLDLIKILYKHKISRPRHK